MKFLKLYLLLLVCSVTTICVNAQAANNKSFLKISGEVTKPLNLSAADIASMKHNMVTINGRDGKPITYSGVPVQALLALAGVTVGKELRGENLAKYLLVKCADGYEVAFSLAELDSSFTDRVVVLADLYEGKPLSEDKGPFRLAVPGEKKPARSCSQVTEFVIKFAKD